MSLLSALEWAFLVASCIGVALAANRGFDVTDEAYYVAWIVDPSRFEASIHPFGLPLHFVYRLAGGSLVFTRVFGLLCLAVSGALLGLFLARYCAGHLRGVGTSAFMRLGALFSLSYYGTLWVETPSYNLMANAGAAVILAGVLGWRVSDGRGEQRDWVASVCVGVGAFLASFGKPTFAAVAGLFVLVLLIRAWSKMGRRVVVRRVAIATIALVVPTALVLAGSGAREVVASIRVGLKVLRFGNSLDQLPLRIIGDLYHSSPVFKVTVVVFGLILVDTIKGDAERPARVWARMAAGAVLLLNFGALVIAIVRGISSHVTPLIALGDLVLSTVLAQIAFGVGRAPGLFMRNQHLFVPVWMLLALPVAVAFGSTNPLLLQSALTAFSIFLASVVAAEVLFEPALAWFSRSIAVLLTGVLLLWSASAPHGLPAPIWSQTERVDVPFSRGPLFVDESTANYVRGLRRVASMQGLTSDVPVMDLSGGGPGTALVLNDGAPFYPWLVHIFPSSGSIADAAWESLSPERRRAAWFVGPVHPAFANTAPGRMFAREQSRYRLVGAFQLRSRGEERLIQIWKPVQGATHSPQDP